MVTIFKPPTMSQRAHLFRGMRKDNRQWVEGFYSNLFDEEQGREVPMIAFQGFYAADMSYPYAHVSTTHAEVDPDTVGEFTGKCDKHDTKIFDGSRLEFDKDEWGGDDNIHTVSWDDDKAAWDWGGGSASDMQYRTVIGTIHDTPPPCTH